MFSSAKILKLFALIFGIAIAVQVLVLGANELAEAQEQSKDRFNVEALSIFLAVKNTIGLSENVSEHIAKTLGSSDKEIFKNFDLKNFTDRNIRFLSVSVNHQIKTQNTIPANLLLIEGFNSQLTALGSSDSDILLNSIGEYWLIMKKPIFDDNLNEIGFVSSITNLSDNISNIQGEIDSVNPSQIKIVERSELLSEEADDTGFFIENYEKSYVKKSHLFDDWFIVAKSSGSLLDYISTEALLNTSLTIIFIFAGACVIFFLFLNSEVLTPLDNLKAGIKQRLSSDNLSEIDYGSLLKDKELNSLLGILNCQKNKSVSDVKIKSADNFITESDEKIVNSSRSRLNGLLLGVRINCDRLAEAFADKVMLNVLDELCNEDNSSGSIYKSNNAYFFAFFKECDDIDAEKKQHFISSFLMKSGVGSSEIPCIHYVQFSETKLSPEKALEVLMLSLKYKSYIKSNLDFKDYLSLKEGVELFEQKTHQLECVFKPFIKATGRPTSFEVQPKSNIEVVDHNRGMAEEISFLNDSLEAYYKKLADNIATLSQTLPAKKTGAKLDVNISEFIDFSDEVVNSLLKQLELAKVQMSKINIIIYAGKVNKQNISLLKVIRDKGISVYVKQDTSRVAIEPELLRESDGVVICCSLIDFSCSNNKQDIGSAVAFYHSYGVKTKFCNLSSQKYAELKQVISTSEFSGDFSNALITEGQVSSLIEASTIKVNAF